MGSKTAARLPKHDATPAHPSSTLCCERARHVIDLAGPLVHSSACTFRQRAQIYLHSPTPHWYPQGAGVLGDHAQSQVRVRPISLAHPHITQRVDMDHLHRSAAGVMFFARRRMHDPPRRVPHPALTHSPLRSTAHAHPQSASHTPPLPLSQRASKGAAARTAPFTRA